jgi:hypothetical protein
VGDFPVIRNYFPGMKKLLRPVILPSQAVFISCCLGCEPPICAAARSGNMGKLSAILDKAPNAVSARSLDGNATPKENPMEGCAHPVRRRVAGAKLLKEVVFGSHRRCGTQDRVR